MGQRSRGVGMVARHARLRARTTLAATALMIAAGRRPAHAGKTSAPSGLRSRSWRRAGLPALLSALLLAPVAHAQSCMPGWAPAGAACPGAPQGEYCCHPCTVGQYSANGASCQACGPGTIAKKPGSPICSACQYSTVSNVNHTKCVFCTGNTVPNADHSACTACTADTIPNKYFTACVTCPVPTVPNAKHTACVLATLPHATTPGLLESSPLLPRQGPAPTGTPLGGGGPAGARGPAGVR